MIRQREAILMESIDHIAGVMDGLDKLGNVIGGEMLAQAIFNARAFVNEVKRQEGIPDTMGAGWNRPARAGTDDVVGTLTDAAERVAIGDSFEGFVMWEMPMGEPELEGADFGLTARYRVGNLDGQGGLRTYTPRE
jgi:hypothetical protein